MNGLSHSLENGGEMPPPTSGRPSGAQGGASSSNGAVGGRSSGAKRGRPVITVLEARPMNEVGFRDQSGSNPAAKRPKPEITVIGARPMSQADGSGASGAPGPHNDIYAEIPPLQDRPVQPQAQRGRMDILPPPDEEAPPTYHEAITETGADGGPPPPDLPNRPASLAPPKSAPPPRPKSLPPPRPAAPPSRGSSAPTSPAEGAAAGATDASPRTSRNISTSSSGSGVEAAPARPPPPGRGKPVARPRSIMAPGASSVPSGGETNPEDFVPIKGKKPIGIAVLPLPNKPSMPVPAPRDKPHTEAETTSQRPEPTPRKPGPSPVKPNRMPISVSMDSIPHNNTATAEQADNIENMERVEQSQSEMPAVRVLPSMPISASMDNIRNESKNPAPQTQTVVPTPRKRPAVKPRPVSMPPSELELAVPSGGTTNAQGLTTDPSSGGEINKRLSGSAFALHIEEDAHALVPRELRGSKPNLAPKPNKPPKPSTKSKPVLPSKPKPPAVAAKPKVKQSRTSWYADTGEPADVVVKPKEGQRTTWYAPPVETENLMDLTSPKKVPEPLPHGPTIIRRSTSKQTVDSEPPTKQTAKMETEKVESSDKAGVTPFDSPEKTAAPSAAAPEPRRPTIIKPLKAKTIKSFTHDSSLSNSASKHPAEESGKEPSASEKMSFNVTGDTHSGTDIKANAQTTVNLPTNSVSDVPSQPVPKPTILRPATLPKSVTPTSPTGEKRKGPVTAAKPLVSPKVRTSHHEELSENIENEAKRDSCATDTKQIPAKLPHSAPEECLACKNDDDEFYNHTCEKAPPKSPVRSPPKSPAKSPRMPPIGFEALMGHLHASDTKQDKTDTSQPITVDTGSNQPISVQTHSPNQSNISVEESNKGQPQEIAARKPADHLNEPESPVTASQSPTTSQSSPKPEVHVQEAESKNVQTAVSDENMNQGSKVPPPLPSAPPVGSQWDLRQLQVNSPTRPDQPPTPTSPRTTPDRETTPDGQDGDSKSTTPTTVKKTPPGCPPPARPAPPRPSGPPRPATSPASKKLYPSLSTEVAAAAAETEADNVSASPKSPPARPASKPSKDGAQPPPLPERPGPGHPLYHYVVSGPYGIALFDYSGHAPDDLSFKSGDVIELISWVDKDWMRGKVATREGIFPVNFCDVVEPLPEQKPVQEKVSVKMPSWDDVDDTTTSVADIKGPKCVARFEFEGEGEEDLSFKEGDVIILKQRVGEWLRGELRGKSGIFPLAFVEIIEDLPSEPPSVNGSALSSVSDVQQPKAAAEREKDEEPHCVAVHSYTSGNAEDLNFSEGDRITLTQRFGPDWLTGKIGDKSGIFPANFVKIIKDIEEQPEASESSIASQNAPQESYPMPVEAVSQESITPSAPPAMPEDEPPPSVPQAAASEAVPPVGPPPVAEHAPEAVHTPSARAMFDFDGETPEDISFKVGDKIELLGKIGDGSWLEGRLADGRTGMFPANFVSVTHPLPDS